jgi:transposase
VFLDEVGAHLGLTPAYGRAPAGRRVAGAVPQAHWQMTTLVSAVRLTGVVASLAFEGATDEAAFRVYVEQVLVPALRPGDIVALDNLKPHKAVWVARVIEAAGAQAWYLPPYSPDFNPIEKLWVKVKAHLRRAEARTPEGLLEAFARALREVTPEECQGFFEVCGYHATPNCKPS